jgi:hypothetical protein
MRVFILKLLYIGQPRYQIGSPTQPGGDPEHMHVITNALKTRVTSIKLANMTGDLQRGSEEYCKDFMATKAIEALLMERVYGRLSGQDVL